ncbi:MAG TPA: hypothetical protein VFC63_23295 [Blastocatellia bacterium]|nr:hypothetical protein [Blastocatellia bacterium]
MKSLNRKTAPRSIYGRVQKKNNWILSPNYYRKPEPTLFIDRKRPGEGFRHVLKRSDIIDFIRILPNWPELSEGLDAIVLSPGNPLIFGYHRYGVVHVCAWERDLWMKLSTYGYLAEKEYLDRLGVPCELRNGEYLCKFTENTVRAHQLLATLLHELGHHHDRITTKSKRCPGRGEKYAYDYAREYTEMIWERYLDTFEL